EQSNPDMPPSDDPSGPSTGHSKPETVPVALINLDRNPNDRPPPESDGDTDVGREPDALYRGNDGGLRDAALLARGKIGSPNAVEALRAVAFDNVDLGTASTAVHSLGLIGERARGALAELSSAHPDAYIRDQATRTLARLVVILPPIVPNPDGG